MGSLNYCHVVICDDDEKWLETAADILGKYAHNTGQEFAVTGYTTASEMLSSDLSEVAVIFMDIDLKEKENGIVAVHRINQNWPGCQVVYLTNYLFYATEVYETEHAWFLLKEQFEEKLPAVMDRIRSQKERSSGRFVFTAADHQVISLKTEDILYLERKQRETIIVSKEGEYRTRSKLSELQKKLPETEFLRCHNSYLVSLPAVSAIKREEVVMENGTVLLISRGYSKSFRSGFLKWAAEEMPYPM